MVQLELDLPVGMYYEPSFGDRKMPSSWNGVMASHSCLGP